MNRKRVTLIKQIFLIKVFLQIFTIFTSITIIYFKYKLWRKIQKYQAVKKIIKNVINSFLQSSVLQPCEYIRCLMK